MIRWAGTPKTPDYYLNRVRVVLREDSRAVVSIGQNVMKLFGAKVGNRFMLVIDHGRQRVGICMSESGYRLCPYGPVNAVFHCKIDCSEAREIIGDGHVGGVEIDDDNIAWIINESI